MRWLTVGYQIFHVRHRTAVHRAICIHIPYSREQTQELLKGLRQRQCVRITVSPFIQRGVPQFRRCSRGYGSSAMLPCAQRSGFRAKSRGRFDCCVRCCLLLTPVVRTPTALAAVSDRLALPASSCTASTISSSSSSVIPTRPSACNALLFKCVPENKGVDTDIPMSREREKESRGRGGEGRGRASNFVPCTQIFAFATS